MSSLFCRIKEFAVAFVVIAASFASSSIASTAAEKEALEDDFSRADLFKLMVDRLMEKAEVTDKSLFRPYGFGFPDDAVWEDPDRKVGPRKNAIFGIDVSHHNEDGCACKIDWAAIQAQKIAFVYVKASQGTRSFDRRFDEYWRDIQALPPGKRIFRGAYHFMSSEGAAQEQARNFLEMIGGKVGPTDMPPSLDLEWDIRTGPDRKLVLDANGKARDFWDTIPPQEIIDRTLEWLRTVESATGRTPMLYTNRAWWNERIKDEKKFSALSRYNIWIADYSRNGRAQERPAVPNRAHWHLWQFTASARFTGGGLPSSVDGDIFKGTALQFRTQMGLGSDSSGYKSSARLREPQTP